MKYIDADILRAKVTDLCANANFYQQKAMEESNREDFVSYGGEISAYAKALSLITALQQEQEPDAEEITPIMAEYVADVFSRKEHLDNISYGYCMEISAAFRRYAERAKQKQSEVDL